MSKAVLKNATSWLKQYNKSHEVSLDNEKWYWQQIRDTAVKGSTAYKQATSQLNKLNSSSTISKALSSSIKNNFGVSKEKLPDPEIIKRKLLRTQKLIILKSSVLLKNGWKSTRHYMLPL